ncbi:MAG: asparagine synthase-related protein [Planctomycetota bacterium]
MAGLAGRVSRAERADVAPALLEAFRAVQSHPGAELVHRTYAADGCAISIALTGIVPGSTLQPARDPFRGAALFLEGDVFNLSELGRNLGEDARASPAATALGLILRDGIDAVSRFDGNFNVVLYEPRARRLTIANDRFAARPLYYLEEDGALIFGSEKKSILAVAASPPRVDGLGLLQVFAHRHNLLGRTFLEGLRRLLPASKLEYDERGLRVSRSERLAFRASARMPVADLVEEGAEKLRRAAARRVRPGRGVLLSLSGGLDSRAVACALSRDLRPLWARTRGYASSREYLCASEVARRLGFEHHREDPDAVPFSRILPLIVWRTEGAVVFLNCTTAASHGVMKAHGDILLGGQYGDVSSGAHIYPYMLVPRSREAFIRRAFAWYRVYDREALARIFAEDFLREHFPRLEPAFFESFADMPGSNIEAYQIWDLEERQARMTVAAAPVDSHLFEAPYPFLDREYVDFCLSLKTRLRFGQALYQPIIHRLGPELRDVPYANTGLRLRRTVFGNRANALAAEVLKAATKAMRTVLPRFRPEGLRVEKEGVRKNVSGDPLFRRVIEDFLSSRDFDPAIFDAGRIRRTLDEQYGGGPDRSHLLAILATFAVAFRYFVGKRPLAAPAEIGTGALSKTP